MIWTPASDGSFSADLNSTDSVTLFPELGEWWIRFNIEGYGPIAYDNPFSDVDAAKATVEKIRQTNTIPDFLRWGRPVDGLRDGDDMSMANVAWKRFCKNRDA